MKKSKLLIRAGITVLILSIFSVAAWLLLPWWLPKKLVSALVADHLSRQFDRAVSIGGLEMSWDEGVYIEYAVLEKKPMYGTGPLLHLNGVTMPLRPGDILKKKVNEIVVQSADLHIVTGEDGQINITDLPETESEPFRLKADSVNLWFSDMAAPLLPVSKFTLRDVELFRGLEGDMQWQAQGYSEASPGMSMTTKGEIEENGTGSGSIIISDMDLEQYSAAHVSNRIVGRLFSHEMPFFSLMQGRASLEVTVEVRDYMLSQLRGACRVQELAAVGTKEGDFSLHDFVVRGVVLASAQGTDWRVQLEELDVRGPGVEMRCRADYPLNEEQSGPLAVTLVGAVIEPRPLLEMMPVLGKTNEYVIGDGGKVALSGQCRITNPSVVDGYLEMDATGLALSGFRVNGQTFRWHKISGQAMTLAVSGNMNGMSQQGTYTFVLEDTTVGGEFNGRDGHYEVSAEWQIREVAKLLNTMPDVDLWLRENGIMPEGSCSGVMRVLDAKERFRGHFIFAGDELDLRIKKMLSETKPVGKDLDVFWLDKPAGVEGFVAIDINADKPTRDWQCESTVRLDRLTAELSGAGQYDPGWSPPKGMPDPCRLTFTFKGEGLEEAAEFLPEGVATLSSLTGDVLACRDLRGAVRFDGALQRQPFGWRMALTGDGTDMAFRIINTGIASDDAMYQWHKTSGEPARFHVKMYQKNNPGTRFNPLALPWLSLQPCRLELQEGRIDWCGSRLDFWAAGDFPAAWPNGKLPLLRQVRDSLDISRLMTVAKIRLTAAGYLAGHERWRRFLDVNPVSPGIEKMEGRTTYYLDWNWDRRSNVWAGNAGVDLREMEIVASSASAGVRLHKPLGDALALNATLRSTQGGRDLIIERGTLDLPHAQVGAFGAVQNVKMSHWHKGDSQMPWDHFAAEVTVQIDELAELYRWFAAEDVSDILFADPRGSLSLFFTVTGDSTPAPKVRLGRVSANADLQALWQEKPLALRVDNLLVEPDLMHVDTADIKLGNSDLTLVGELRDPAFCCPRILDPNRVPRGRLDMISHTLDIEELTAIIKSVVERLSSSPAEPNAAARPAADTETCEYDDVLATWARADITGSLQVDRLRFYDKVSGAMIEPDRLLCEFGLTEGLGRIDLTAALNGGVLEEHYTFDLTVPGGQARYQRLARVIAADEAIAPLVESEFPGMEISGRLSQRFDMTAEMRCLFAGRCDWKGTGTTTCNGGMLFGPGGPGWMIRVFPGLELVEYPWKRMTNDYESFGDGRKQNHMVFNGKRYNIYINGMNEAVDDPDKYERVIEMIRGDLRQDREKLSAEGAKLEERWRQRLQDRIAGLEGLLERHRRGERLPVSEADYIVGALVSIERGGRFEGSREILRIPIFETHSFIVGRFMIGMETRNAGIDELGRENPIYRLLRRE